MRRLLCVDRNRPLCELSGLGVRGFCEGRITRYTVSVTPIKRITAFRLDADLLGAMRRLHERDGISLSEQARRSLRPWLEVKGVLKPERVRARSRKRT